MATQKCRGCGEEYGRVGYQQAGRLAGEIEISVYCHECCTKPVCGGFTRAELFEAFEMIKPDGNWKNPIEKFIGPVSAHQIQAIHRAIEFYCGGGAKFQHLGPHKIRVTAPGYYALIGA